MGLNAKNMSKSKNKPGKKKGGATSKKAAKSQSNGTPARAKAHTIDTNRREYIYQMAGVNKTLSNGKQILKNINLSYFPGVKIGVVGENGSGKSSLLKIIAGLDSEYDGIAAPQAGIRIGYLAQDPELPEPTVDANITLAVAETRAALDRYAQLGAQIADPDLSEDDRTRISEEWERLQNKIEAANGWELERNIERARDALRCPPGDAEVVNLSGGERRRVALCSLLLKRPELLVLDEPTNHLDALSVLWLQRFLETFEGTLIVVTHDRFFLESSTDWILELDNGKAYPYEGNYSTYLEKKAKRMADEEKVASSRQKLIQQELEWMRSNPKAQQAKSKARISRFDNLVEEDAQSEKRSKLDRIYIPPGPMLGNIVVEAKDVRKGFGERVLFENMNFALPRGGIVGVIGPNGSGKVWYTLVHAARLAFLDHFCRLRWEADSFRFSSGWLCTTFFSLRYFYPALILTGLLQSIQSTCMSSASPRAFSSPSNDFFCFYILSQKLTEAFMCVIGAPLSEHSAQDDHGRGNAGRG